MIDQLFQTISLNNLDSWWQITWNNSLAGRLMSLLARLPIPKAAAIGDYLQSRSYIGIIVLFSILALEVFVDDKNGLALIVVGCASCWLLGSILGGHERRKSGGIDIPVWLYFAANVVATASSYFFHASVFGLEKLIVYIVAYFLFTALFQQSTSRKFYVSGALLLTAVGIVFYGLYQYKMGVAPLATWEDPTVETQGVRIFSTLRNPNLLAGYLVPLAPFAAGLSLAAFLKNRKVLGVGATLICFVITLGSVLTGSRGGFIGLFVGFTTILVMFGAYAWQTFRSKRKWIITGCVTVPVVALLALHFVPAFEQRAMSIFAGRDHSSNSYRMNVYEASKKMFYDSWWVGVGPGNKAFEEAYGLYMYSKFDALGAYCVPLEIVDEAGIPALLSFICLLAAVFARGHICFWEKTTEQHERWMAAAATAALLAMMAHGIFDTVFYRPQVQFIFWLLIALLATAKLKTADKQN